jgi:hypothetical protein
MYKADIRVTAQVQENYNWYEFDGKNPHWKNKGGIEFVIPQVDSDAVMYAAPGEVETTIQSMLDDRSSDYIKYTLISWEFIWTEPIELDEDVFHKRMGIEVE